MNKVDKDILYTLKREFNVPQHVKVANELILKGITSEYFMKFCKSKEAQKLPDHWKCNTYNSLRDYEILGKFPTSSTN